jgi:hypothetical protein
VLAQPVSRDFDDAVIMPVVNGRLPDGATMRHFGDGRAQVSAGFRLVDMDDPATTADEDYRGLPVLSDPVVFSQSINHKTQHAQQWVEPPTGEPMVRIDREWSEFFQPITVLAETQADIARLRGWFANRRGALTPFWMASTAFAFTLQADAVSADSAIYVDDREYRNWEKQHRFMRDLAIVKDDGTTLYRRITGASKDSLNSRELISLDQVLGVDLTVGQTRIHFLQPWLLPDRWQIQHGHNSSAHFSAELEACLDEL